MRLYKITALNTSKGEQPDSETHWVGSKAEGVAKRKQLAVEGWTRKEINEVEIEVPTNKEGLLQWLNSNAS